MGINSGLKGLNVSSPGISEQANCHM